MDIYRFLVVIEKANNNYSVYSPEPDGYVATGVTREGAKAEYACSHELHVQGLLEDDYFIHE